ncbi:MAG: DUF3018 family protein [Gammaproteobacteria bacterium]|nr:DUF3018 family protein [Gammaproteobacteria bacterium]
MQIARHRRALRAAGLRPIQIWVPDTRRRGFAAECRKQSRSLQDDVLETATLAQIEATADLSGWR